MDRLTDLMVKYAEPITAVLVTAILILAVLILGY